MNLRHFFTLLLCFTITGAVQAEEAHRTTNLVGDLDLDRYSIIAANVNPREMQKNVVRIELVRRGIVAGLVRNASDNDVFAANYYDNNGDPTFLGEFSRGSLARSEPYLRNIAAVASTVGQIVAMATGYEIGVAGLAIAGQVLFYGPSLLNLGAHAATGVRDRVKPQGQRSVIDRGADGVANSLNPAYQSGRATVERVMKVVLWNQREITSIGQELVLVGSPDLRIGTEGNHVNLTLNAGDGAHDVAEKVRDFIVFLNRP